MMWKMIMTTVKTMIIISDIWNSCRILSNFDGIFEIPDYCSCDIIWWKKRFFINFFRGFDKSICVISTVKLSILYFLLFQKLIWNQIISEYHSFQKINLDPPNFFKCTNLFQLFYFLLLCTLYSIIQNHHNNKNTNF